MDQSVLIGLPQALRDLTVFQITSGVLFSSKPNIIADVFIFHEAPRRRWAITAVSLARLTIYSKLFLDKLALVQQSELLRTAVISSECRRRECYYI